MIYVIKKVIKYIVLHAKNCGGCPCHACGEHQTHPHLHEAAIPQLHVYNKDLLFVSIM